VPDLSALAPTTSEQAPPAVPDEVVPDEAVPVEPDRGEAGLDVGAPEPVEPEPTVSAVVPATVESVRDDVEEIVVEQALAVERNRHSAPNGQADTATPGPSTAGDRSDHDASTPRSAPGGRPASDQVSGPNGAAVSPGSATADTPEPVGRRRRGRVTRTAGAPTAVTGDAPTVAVVTVPSARAAEEQAEEPAAGDVAGPPAPEPVIAPRARRVRRAASRPAGPPAPDSPDVSGAEPPGEAAPQ
jgi:ribonuclease E